MRGPESRWVPGFIALGIVWGSSFLFIEWALESFTPAGIVFWRGLLGAVSLGIFLVVRRERLPGKGRHWFHLSVVALLLNALPGLLFAVGQQWVSSSLAGVINATTPLMTVMVIFTFFRNQNPTGNQILGILLGILGYFVRHGDLQRWQRDISGGCGGPLGSNPLLRSSNTLRKEIRREPAV